MKKLVHIASATLTLTLTLFTVSIAQNTDTETNQSLDTQYKTLIEKSENYTDYKVIKKDKLNAFWAVVQDSSKAQNNRYNDAQSKIKSLDTKIADLDQSIIVKDKALIEGEAEKTNISVIGMDWDKSNYATLSIVLYLVLIVAIGILIVRANINTAKTNTAQKRLLEVENEYEEYKKNALDKQMRLKRELQTERNRISEITH